ncbi:MAG: hypothetical protein Q4B99_05955 [Clostridia bacterium]|nr:hypothetical protein [Clostridia bacterium]
MNSNIQYLGVLSRTGWREEEDALLFSEIKRVRAEGRPLRDAFDSVASRTGRKPNSVRNYYYTRIKDEEAAKQYGVGCSAFVPFTEEELHHLIRTVLLAQANGMSVRACTLQMGNGETKAMLRYQNKYRAVLRTRADLIHQVNCELEQEGLPTFDPYARAALKRAREEAPELSRAERLDGFDMSSFMNGLSSLIEYAVQGAEAIRRLKELQMDESAQS